MLGLGACPGMMHALNTATDAGGAMLVLLCTSRRQVQAWRSPAEQDTAPCSPLDPTGQPD